ncbi:hypothetical protein [Acinetobacter sp.]|uniref:hypothetical protein n=1 Tax=Acinetobacter sp. TaxID=472 RepID=UPI003BAFF971
MDIQKEREAFEAQKHIKPYLNSVVFDQSKNKYVSEDDCEIVCNHSAKVVNSGWLSWQAKAQAVPEGFVLMPIKPTETMVMAVVKEHKGDAFLPYSLYDAYVKQAMIEAQEPAND